MSKERIYYQNLCTDMVTFYLIAMKIQVFDIPVDTFLNTLHEVGLTVQGGDKNRSSSNSFSGSLNGTCLIIWCTTI